MIKYETLKKISDEIDDLESSIYDLEREKRYLENDKREAEGVSNIGMATMAVNMTVGLSSKMVADNKVRELESKIDKIKDKIYETEKLLSKRKTEYRDALKEWEEERKEAELVIDGDNIYIKGDKDKKDVLESVKSVRENRKNRYNEIKKNKDVMDYVDARIELIQEFEDRGFCHKTDTFKSDFYKDFLRITNYVSFSCQDEIEGYYVPKSGFDKELITVLKNRIAICEDNIANQKKTYERLTPGFFGNLFKAAYNKKYMKVKSLAEHEISCQKLKIAEYEREIKAVLDFKEKYPQVYDEKLNKLIKDYENKRNTLDEKGELHLAREIVEIVKGLKENRCIVHKGVFLPYEVKQYLLENNLSLSKENLVACMDKMDQLDNEIKKDVKNILEDEGGYTPLNQVKKR